MKNLFLITISILISVQTQAQVKAACIAFYNLENLFDTEDDPDTRDEEYLPDGNKQWTKERYAEKLEHMSEVISQLGDEEGGPVWNGPTFLGVCEIENRKVLEDLAATPKLKDSNYGIVHYDSPDKRGVDVGFFYKKDYFKVLSSKAFPLVDPEEPDYPTRDQLLVSGVYDGDTLHFIVNHWPSRFGGDQKRVNAATLCRSIVDSILAMNANAKVFVMGDLNDTPVNQSLNYLTHKSTKRKAEDPKVVELFNPMMDMHKKGYGTITHDDKPFVFDMIIISPGVVNGANNGYKYKYAGKWDRPFLHQTEGRYKGYPLRTHAGGAYLGGYSDHLPVYMYIVKKVE